MLESKPAAPVLRLAAPFSFTGISFWINSEATSCRFPQAKVFSKNLLLNGDQGLVRSWQRHGDPELSVPGGSPRTSGTSLDESCGNRVTNCSVSLICMNPAPPRWSWCSGRFLVLPTAWCWRCSPPFHCLTSLCCSLLPFSVVHIHPRTGSSCSQRLHLRGF